MNECSPSTQVPIIRTEGTHDSSKNSDTEEGETQRRKSETPKCELPHIIEEKESNAENVSAVPSLPAGRRE